MPKKKKYQPMQYVESPPPKPTSFILEFLEVVFKPVAYLFEKGFKFIDEKRYKKFKLTQNTWYFLVLMICIVTPPTLILHSEKNRQHVEYLKRIEQYKARSVLYDCYKVSSEEELKKVRRSLRGCRI